MTTPVSDARRVLGRHPITRLAVYLIKPSKYDDDGYVIRYWHGVLRATPSRASMG